MSDLAKKKSELAFISGIGPDITQLDIIDHYGPNLKSKEDFSVQLQKFQLFDETFILGVASLITEDCQHILKNFSSTKLKDHHLTLIPSNQFTSLVIKGYSTLINEVDAFYQLRSITPDLKRIEIFENPESSKEFVDFMLASYSSHETALSSIGLLQDYHNRHKENYKNLSLFWKDPLTDYSKFIASNSKTILISKLSAQMKLSELKEKLSEFGQIEKIRIIQSKNGLKMLVLFEKIESAKNTIDKLNGKGFDGSVLKITPCKRGTFEKAISSKDKELMVSFHAINSEDQELVTEVLPFPEKFEDTSSVFVAKAKLIQHWAISKLNEKIEILNKRIEEERLKSDSEEQRPMVMPPRYNFKPFFGYQHPYDKTVGPAEILLAEHERKHVLPPWDKLSNRWTPDGFEFPRELPYIQNKFLVSKPEMLPPYSGRVGDLRRSDGFINTIGSGYLTSEQNEEEWRMPSTEGYPSAYGFKRNAPMDFYYPHPEYMERSNYYHPQKDYFERGPREYENVSRYPSDRYSRKEDSERYPRKDSFDRDRRKDDYGRSSKKDDYERDRRRDEPGKSRRREDLGRKSHRKDERRSRRDEIDDRNRSKDEFLKKKKFKSDRTDFIREKRSPLRRYSKDYDYGRSSYSKREEGPLPPPNFYSKLDSNNGNTSSIYGLPPDSNFPENKGYTLEVADGNKILSHPSTFMYSSLAHLAHFEKKSYIGTSKYVRSRDFAKLDPK